MDEIITAAAVLDDKVDGRPPTEFVAGMLLHAIDKLPKADGSHWYGDVAKDAALKRLYGVANIYYGEA